MPRSRFKTCFISAPFGIDTSVLRRSLERNAITWVDLTKLNQADNLIEGIDRALAKSDFVCAILPEGDNPNILFELGMAYTREKPILVILGATVNPPVDIRSLTYFRGDPTDASKVESALKTFLNHAGREGTARKPSTRKRREPRTQLETPIATLPGREYEARTAQLFQDAGFLVSLSKLPSAKGADFAVWIDDLPEPLGNPLLVEVKAGNLTDRAIDEAGARLRDQLMKTQARCGLLIYWHQQDLQIPPVSSKWPLVVQLSGPRLATLLQSRNLTKELLRIRNMAAHSEV